MPVIINGNPLTSLLEEIHATILIDKVNEATATVTYNIQWDNALNAVLALRSHPDYPDLIKESAVIEREEACIAKVTVTFKGIVGDDDERDTVFYSTRGTTSQEPIETHPNFTEVTAPVEGGGTEFSVGFGGEPPAGGGVNDQGAKFDEDGAFLGFIAPTEDGGNSFDPYPDANRTKTGVRSYLLAGFVYTEERTYSRSAVPGLNLNAAKLGHIDTEIPDSPLLPTFEDGRDWLMIEYTVNEIGEGLRTLRSWRLSGPRGWDKDIY